MTRLPWQRLLRVAAVLFALLAVSNLLKPVQLWGVHTGFVLFGHRLSGMANALVPEFEELRHTSAISTRTNKKNQGVLLLFCKKT